MGQNEAQMENNFVLSLFVLEFALLSAGVVGLEEMQDVKLNTNISVQTPNYDALSKMQKVDS